MNFKPLIRMIEKTEIAKQISDADFLDSLIKLGEMTIKIISLFLISSITEDKNRSKYYLKFTLVRASGIGDWAKAIEYIFNSTNNISLFISASVEAKEITEKSNHNWQFESYKFINNCIYLIDSNSKIEENAK